MLSRTHRLTGTGAKFVLRRGRSLAGTALRIKWIPIQYPPSHATVVAGLAVDKRATVRNRLKRQVREALRPRLPSLRFPVNLMVFVLKSAIGRTFQELQTELVSLLTRARIL